MAVPVSPLSMKAAYVLLRENFIREIEILHLCSVVKSMDKSHVFFANCSQYGLCLPARQIVWECAFLMVLGLELFRRRRHANRLRDLGHIAAKLIENVAGGHTRHWH